MLMLPCAMAPAIGDRWFAGAMPITVFGPVDAKIAQFVRYAHLLRID
jgi:hypothetical protein